MARSGERSVEPARGRARWPRNAPDGAGWLIRAAILALVVGVSLGAWCRWSLGSNHEANIALARLGAPWLLAALLAGFAAPPTPAGLTARTTSALGAVAGGGALVVATYVYYGPARTRRLGVAGSQATALTWALVGLLLGVICGATAALWRRNRQSPAAFVGIILTGTAVTAEGVLHLRDSSFGTSSSVKLVLVALLAAGLLLPFVALRRRACAVAVVLVAVLAVPTAGAVKALNDSVVRVSNALDLPILSITSTTPPLVGGGTTTPPTTAPTPTSSGTPLTPGTPGSPATPTIASTTSLNPTATTATTSHTLPSAPVPVVDATAYVVYDPASETFLAASHGDQELAVGSAMKLLTAYVVMQRGDLGHVVTVAGGQPDAKESVIGLSQGEQLPRDVLLRAMLIVSANDAARALAIDAAGSEAAFAELMNDAARSLGLSHTEARNATGLDADGQHSSAHDLAVLAATLIHDAAFRTTVARTSANLHGQAHPSTNSLLGAYRGADGIKTGHTTQAGYCLVASATRNGRTVIVVVLGTASEQSRNTAAASLLDWAFGA